MKKELNLLAKNAFIRHSSSSPKLKTNRNIFEEKLLNNDKEYLNIKLREELKKSNDKIFELNNIIEELKKN